MNDKLTGVLVVGVHSEESIRRVRELPNCNLMITEDWHTVSTQVLQNTEILVGFPNPELVRQLPRLRFVQLYSAGANGYSWLSKEIILSNAHYHAYGHEAHAGIPKDAGQAGMGLAE